MPFFLSFRRSWIVLAGLALLAPAPFIHAQQLGTKDGLLKAFNDNDKRRRDLLSGELEKPEKGDAKLAEAFAQRYIWMTTHRMEPNELQKLHAEFDNVLASALELTFDKKKKKNSEFLDMLAPKLVEAMEAVLERDQAKDAATVVNAALMLRSMAKLKRDVVGDLLVRLIANPKVHDSVRLYAIKSLTEYMPITSLPDDVELTAGMAAKMRKDAKYVDALAKFIETPIPADGVRGDQLAAKHFIRREGIIVLAQAGAPAVLALKKPVKFDKKDNQAEGLVAPTLLKVLAPKGLEPPAKLQEKIEAAVGLASMKTSHMSEYNQDLATYLIGQTISEFISEYSVDLPNFTGIGAAKRLPYIAWRTESKRLEAEVVRLAKNGGKGSNADRLLGKSAPIFARISGGKDYLTIQNDQRIEFNTLLPTLMPKSNDVFKTVKAAPIPLD